MQSSQKSSMIYVNVSNVMIFLPQLTGIHIKSFAKSDLLPPPGCSAKISKPPTFDAKSGLSPSPFSKEKPGILSSQKLENIETSAGTGTGNTTFKFWGTSSCNIIIFKSNTLQAPEQAPENSYTHSCFSVNIQCLAFSSLNLQIPGMLSGTVRSKTTSNSLFSSSKSSQAPEQAPEIPASGQESFERLELTMLGLIRLVTDIKASEELRELQERCYQFGKECFLPGIGRTGICTSLNSVSPHPG